MPDKLLLYIPCRISLHRVLTYVCMCAGYRLHVARVLHVLEPGGVVHHTDVELAASVDYDSGRLLLGLRRQTGAHGQ